ncbi:hypothetical protein GY45DRAFT_1211918, partial [Cubamyces sp. BRFM 1775]
VTVSSPTQTAALAHAEGSAPSAAANVTDEPPRPQAGPLPRKRGEIGFVEGLHDRGDVSAQASASATSLPSRHPADRDAPPDVSAPSGAAAAGAVAGTSTSAGEPPRSPSPNGSTDTTGKRSLISFLKPKRVPTIAGLRATSLAILIFQVCLFGGTIAGWVILIQHMQNSRSSSPSPPDSSSNSSTDPGTGTDNGSTALSQVSSQIFVHVAFGITCLAELIFIERSVFRLRAERYAYVHPGEILPRSSRPSQETSTTMAFAPWNRPPLPTYAAALAQSGVGTGDVEDNIIAIPPPPAYGNTRGSTLLLAGFMSDALRSQRPRSSASAASAATRASRQSWLDVRRRAGDGADEEDRPKSYMSVDPEWEEICDADRALRLEETLARLEEGEG